MAYNHYRHIRTHKPWRVPILYGRMPRLPQESSTPEERGRFAIFMMMLFRPWRDSDEAVDRWSGGSLAAGKIDEVWDKLFLEYLRWRREEIIEPAWPFFRRDVPHASPPAYGTEEWWACMVFTRLLHLELVLTHRKSNQQTKPTEILGLPIEELQPIASVCESEAGDDDSVSKESADADDDLPDTPDEAQEDREISHAPYPVYPAVVGVRCGVVPTLDTPLVLHELLQSPYNVGRRSAESHYAEDFVTRTRESGVDTQLLHRSELKSLAHVDTSQNFGMLKWKSLGPAIKKS